MQFKIFLKFQILCVTAVAAGGSHSESAIKARSHHVVGNAASGDQGWDYGDGGRNDTLVTNAFELRTISPGDPLEDLEDHFVLVLPCMPQARRLLRESC